MPSTRSHRRTQKLILILPRHGSEKSVRIMAFGGFLQWDRSPGDGMGWSGGANAGYG
jgi:hypothetical protein